jgi:hypothetical protein
MNVPLYRLAHARSGDKGDGSNVGLLAYDEACYKILADQVTPAAVKRHFRGIVKGKVERFAVPNLLGFNFLLHDSLGGGGSASLKNDAQGKTHGMALLLMEVVVSPRFSLPQVGKSGALAPGGQIAEPSAWKKRSGTPARRGTSKKTKKKA